MPHRAHMIPADSLSVDTTSALPRTETYSEPTAVASQLRSTPRSRALRVALEPRRLTVFASFVVIAVKISIAFAPVMISNFTEMLDGSPTVYWLLLTPWALTIAYGIDRNTATRVINDKELDWIAAVLIGAIVTVTVYLARNRLPASAALWHVLTIPMFTWIFCGCILHFGIRRTFRGWRVLLFTAVTFPGTLFLVGAEFGGTPLAYSLTVAGFNTFAIWLAFARTTGRWTVAALAAVAGGALAVVVTPASATAGLLVPSILVTTAAVTVLVARPSADPTTRPPMPQRSLVSIAAIGLAAVVALALLPGPLARVREATMVTMPTDWLDRVEQSGAYDIGTTTQYGWAASILGPDGRVVRHPLVGADGDIVYLDVYSTRSLGVLANFRGALWYASNPPAVLAAGERHLDHGLVIVGTQNVSSEVTSPTESLWSAVGWTWKTTDSDGGVLFQRVYLLTSRQSDQPTNVPTPTPPSFSRTILGPLSSLARQGSRQPLPWSSHLNLLADDTQTIVNAGIET